MDRRVEAARVTQVRKRWISGVVFFGHFDGLHPITPDSHKTDGNSVRKTACRETCGFPGRAGVALNGDLMVFPEKG